MKHLFFIALITTTFFVSCKSAPKTTFVNTGDDPFGQIHSVCVFSEITAVTVIEDIEKITAKHELKSENYNYDSSTTELKISLDSENSFPRNHNTAYHIEGIAVFPAEFVLNGYDKSQGNPAVFYSDKVAKLGKDYTFDKDSSHLVFLKKIDADKDSYEITWTTKDGMSSIGNKTEKYAELYKEYTLEWIETLVKQ